MNPESDFVRLWTRHQAEVGRYVFSMIPRQADAEVVLQDVSILLWKKWDKYDAERPFVPWAIRFAYLEILKWRQKLAREKLVFSDSLLEQMHSQYDKEMPLMEARRGALTKCLELLNEQQRKWVQLRYGRHGAVKEEADKTGISMHKIYYALEKIRDQLQLCIEERLQKEGWSDA
ncbi:MAG: sigma-70 family RNA polymerase sigma factor [Verrucomicrobiales bacterium]